MPAYLAYLVREGHLERVKGIIHVFDHLRHVDRGLDHGAREAGIKVENQIRHFYLVRTHHGLGRIKKIMDRSGFSEEFGIKANMKSLAFLLARHFLEQWYDLRLEQSGQHRA